MEKYPFLCIHHKIRPKRQEFAYFFNSFSNDIYTYNANRAVFKWRIINNAIAIA